MWAICVEYYGKLGAYVPAGNDGIQRLRNKTRQGWLRETEAMRRNTTGNVYVVSSLTQKMCEMSPHELGDYVGANNVCCL